MVPIQGQVASSIMTNDPDTNGTQNQPSKSGAAGAFASVDNNVDLFSSIMSAAPGTSVRNDDFATNDIDSISQQSSLQCDQEIVENEDCEYLKMVMGFKRTLVLPDVFFSYEMPVCYCLPCASSSRIDHSCVKGQFQCDSAMELIYSFLRISQVGSDSKSIIL